MFRWLIYPILVSAAVVAALFYWIYLPQSDALDQARREASRCVQDATTLRGRIADLQSMLDLLQQNSEALADQVAEKEQELAATRTAQDELMAELEQEIDDGHIQVERLRDQLKVDLIDEILFASGEAELTPAGTDVLLKVGGILKKIKGRTIVVQGHTDNVQIVGKLAERYPTNWELSAARAVNVVRFLQQEAGIDPQKLSAAEFSQYRPRADNDTQEGRQQNRRIEIVLVPAPILVPGESGEEPADTAAEAQVAEEAPAA